MVCNGKTPKNLVAFNFLSSQVSINADDVPTLVSDKVMSELTNGDENPYFKIQAINYPVNGSGIYPHDEAVYTEEFFESFVNVTKERPIPGSKRGHEWGSRPNNDFYMVGGSLVKNGDGKGTVYFKNYIPPEGDGTSNLGFLRDLKAGIVHFSLVTMPEYNVSEDEKMYITGSIGHERNDAVQYGDGAMEQTTNSKYQDEFFERAKNLISDGKIDIKTRANSGEPIQNGKVVRSVLRRIVARANVENTSDFAELISMIDKQKRGANMDKDELFKLLGNMKQNGEITLSEVANAMGLKDQVVTDDHKSAASVVNSLKEIDVADPVKEIKELRNKLEAVDADRVKNALDAAFGPEKDSDGKDNPVRQYAGKMTKDAKADNIDAKIEELKNDSVMKQLAGNKADYRSEQNTIGVVENRQGDGSKDEPQTYKY